jgi:glycerophosphoryl diester phosphodiesterase
MSGCACIGHGGASALERANTLASFDTAREVGVDVIEFDVRAWRGELVLAHTVLHARFGWNLRLRDALAHLAQPDFAGIGLHLDVKHTGCEAAILGELARARVQDRAMVCSQVPSILDGFRALDPDVQVGVSVGRLARVRRHWASWRTEVLDGLSQRRWNALMAQHTLIDSDLVGQVCARGAELYAWTVNERSLIQRMQQLGVHGITTADPRLFT